MSKINAIYAALDNGNPKSAMRLCQQALSKSPSQLVRALMALSLSRLDQSEEALSICTSLLDQRPSDTSVIEMIGYVLRRESRFDLLSEMLESHSSAVDEAEAFDLNQQAFIAGVQGRKFTSLPSIAMKLAKRDPKYFAWAAFALALQGDEKLPLALAMIDKVPAPAINELGDNRHTTSGRMHAYLALFKLQILARLGRFEDAATLVSGIHSTLVSEKDKQQLLCDIQRMQAGAGVGVETDREGLCLDRIEAHILANADGWKDEAQYSLFIVLLKELISDTVGRADCVVVVSPYIALVAESDPTMADHVKSLLSTSTSDQSVTNLFKLLYALDLESTDAGVLMSRAMEMVRKEDDLDECSPGKQLLLLSAVRALEHPESLEFALGVLSYGSERFKQCSHFRVVEAIAYSRNGLMAKAVERFEALGIKNAQWRDLWWIIGEPLAKFFSPYTMDLLDNVEMFFSHHESDLRFALSSVVKEGMFFKYWNIDNGIRQIESSEMKAVVRLECAWDQVMVQGESLETEGVEALKKSFENAQKFHDFSPLLSLAFPAVGSTTTAEFARKIRNQTDPRSRVMGFRWNERDTLGSDQMLRLSTKRYLGKAISTESATREDRLSQMAVVSAALSGDWNDAISRGEALKVKNPWTAIIQTIAAAVVDARKGEVIEAHTATAIDQIDTAFSCTEQMGEWANGLCSAVGFVIERTFTEFSKKGNERKYFKQILNDFRDRLGEAFGTLNALYVEERTIIIPEGTPEEIAHCMNKFASKFASYKQADVDAITLRLKSVIDRLALVKP